MLPLKITFLNIPFLYNTLSIKFADANGNNAVNRVFIFVSSRVHIGEVEHASNVNQQAINFTNALLSDYPNEFTATVSENTVNVYCVNGTFPIDYGNTTSGDNWCKFQSFEVITPYAQNTFAYTLENKSFKIQSGLVDAYFQITALITINRNNGQSFKFTILNKLMTFKNEASISYNQMIHRLMAANLDIETQGQYKPALLGINVKAFKNSDNSLIDEIGFLPIKFIAGLKNSNSSFGILDFNLKPSRATPLSFPYVNLLLPVGNYTLRTLRNGIFDNDFSIVATDDVVLPRQLNFEGYKIGDVISVVTLNDDHPNLQTQEKVFCIFPEQRYFNTIFWEDEFLMQKSIDCMGDYLIKSDLENTTQKIVVNLVEKLEILNNSKDAKLQINTGWLMYSDTDTVESIMRAKKAWLPVPNSNKIIDLRPIGKSIVNENSQDETIQYNLEFIINKKYNEETYSLKF